MRSFLALALMGMSLGANAALNNAAAWKAKVAELSEKKVDAPEVAAKKPKYLNAKTKKFVVDGTKIPQIDFDLGETYAGMIPVDDTGKELFFWFIPSDNPDATDEITIWLNGGPGCSSLDGFFHENGPVTWMSGTYRPVKNHYAWNNLTNVVWVEQPFGTGYSAGFGKSHPNATDEHDVATQFNAWFKNFADIFSIHNKKVYVTGESYAGQYVPYISDAMIKEKDPKYFDVKGAMIYDPSIGYDAITEVVPTLAFVERNRQSFPFDDAFMANLRKKSKSCGFDKFMKEALTFPPKGPFPDPPSTKGDCNLFYHVFDSIFELNPCFDIYQVSQLCPLLWDTEGFPYSRFYLPQGYKNPYFNRTAVKQALNAPMNVDWEICADGVFPHGDASRPSGLTGGPVARVAEHTGNMVVGHGMLDMVLIAEGSLMTLNNLTWNGKQGFSTAPNKDFYVPYHDDPRRSSMAGAGIFGKWVTERGLTFVEIEASGHMVPEFQPSAGYRNLEFLLGRIKDMSEVSAFSTQPGYPQPKRFKKLVNGGN